MIAKIIKPLIDLEIQSGSGGGGWIIPKDPPACFVDETYLKDISVTGLAIIRKAVFPSLCVIP